MKTLIEKYDVWRKEYHSMALMNEAMAEAAWIAAYGEAVLAEREECANLAAWILKMPQNDVSAAIRARSIT